MSNRYVQLSGHTSGKGKKGFTTAAVLLALALTACGSVPAAPAAEPAPQEAEAGSQEEAEKTGEEAGDQETAEAAEESQEEAAQDQEEQKETAGEEAEAEPAGEDAAEEKAVGEVPDGKEAEETGEEVEISAKSFTAKEAGKRRELPHEPEKPASEKKKDVQYPNLEDVETPSVITGNSVMFVENTAVKEAAVVWKDNSYPDSQEDVDSLLADLFNYWQNNEMDAVDYLIRMGKYRYLSQMLSGTNDYFYVGEENEEGLPHGKGLMAYAGNAYYYGDFVNGKRSGEGFWYQVFDKEGNYCKENNGIYGHSYRGEWKDDLPFGIGQEHLDIDIHYLKKRIVTNVLGTFAGGYYNGTQDITTLEKEEGIISWRGTAFNGTWVTINKGAPIDSSESKGEIPVLENIEREGNYFWMKESENRGQGITGLIP